MLPPLPALDVDVQTATPDHDVVAARQWYANLDRELREVLRKAHLAPHRDIVGAPDAIVI